MSNIEPSDMSGPNDLRVSQANSDPFTDKVSVVLTDSAGHSISIYTNHSEVSSGGSAAQIKASALGMLSRAKAAIEAL